MTFEAILQALSGLGALGAAAIIIWGFLTERIVPKGRLDDQKLLTKEAIEGWKASVSANERLADAWEARNAAETRFAEERSKR